MEKVLFRPETDYVTMPTGVVAPLTHKMGRGIGIDTDERGGILPEGVREAATRFALVKSTLPIKSITIAAYDEDRINVLLKADVRDIHTGELKELVFGQMFRWDEMYAYRYGNTLQESVGNMIRLTMQYAMNHEIDEILMLDNDHFTDPHPETNK